MKGEAIISVSTPQSCFSLEGCAGGQRRLPLVHELRKVVWMNDAGPAPSQKVIQGNAQVFHPALIEEIQISVRASAVEHRGSGIDHEPDAIFGLFAILDIGIRTIPSDDAFFGVLQRHAPREKPTILPVRATTTNFLLVRLTRHSRLLHGFS